ncbi:MAG: Transcriptional regulator MntR [Pelotomaculum sp. PtaU1.Bin035]|nr:MAG: Transcriptional regulator MntR [Pelotomaculum sp. PtaU1.Bin035]
MENNKEFHTVRGYEILNKDKRKLTPSMEDYLEMIYRNYLTEGYIRINHIKEKLHVRASSASKVVQKLSELGYLDYEKYGIIQLTEKGREIGKSLLERHKTIETFLKNLGVGDNAFIDTELIEHDLSMDTLNKIQIFNHFFAANPDIIKRLHQFKISNHDDK